MTIKQKPRPMAKRRNICFVFTSVLLLALSSLNIQTAVSSSTDDGIKKIYIAYLGEKHHEDPEVVTSLHHDTLCSLLGSKEEALASIVYSYKHGFSGFAAWLTDSQAKKLKGMKGILGVNPSQAVQASTTRSFDFLGLSFNSPPSKLLHKARLGEDVIIGVVDSGIWPESKSFDDTGYDLVPKRWKGVCQTGQEFNASHCNKKIIGSRYYDAEIPDGVFENEYRSARDIDGHGTHVASIAAGSFVANVSYGGLGAGSARGGAPRARVAVYKVLFGSPGTGSTASILAAIDDAILDGVDVLNLSIGGNDLSLLPPSLHATMKGIVVVFAAGNDGPLPQTVVNTSPWVITVAASTLDRSFPAAITLGDNHTLVGQAIYFGDSNTDRDFVDMVFAPSCSEQSLNETKYGGKVVLCDPGLSSPASLIHHARNVIQAGGGRGLIFPQHTTNLLFQFRGGFRAIVVDWVVYQDILEYILITGDSAKVKLASARTVEGSTVLAPTVGAFSSRGPGRFFPGIIKPDIAAPGVNILAAVGDSYDIYSGTSMAAPEVSGIVALLKSIHPNWSPAAIKSAIMTTASVVDRAGSPILAEGNPRKIADPFDYGSGHIDPEKAADPGLVYDINPKDFNLFDCITIGTTVCDTPQLPVYHLNLPSISVPDLTAKLVVFRTVTNVGPVDSTYTAIVESPAGVEMVVEPSKLVFDEHNQMHTFTVTFTSRRKVQGVFTFGSLTWKNERHAVRIPIAVRTVIQDSVADVA